MNLLKKEILKSENNISNFRVYQHKLLNYHLKNMFDYTNKFGLNINFDELKLCEKEPLYYGRINDTLLHDFKISYKNEIILDFLYPKLIDKTFYILRGVRYIPIIYCVDAPITIKENSVYLFSLFSPISIEINNELNRVNIQKRQFNISSFLRIFFTENETKNICKTLNFIYTDESDEEIIQKFDKLFENKKQDLESINKIINDLFFDNYTKELYEKFYNNKIETNIRSILSDVILKLYRKEKESFINLKNKRLIMSEILLTPLFQSTTTLVSKLIKLENINKFILKKGNICIFDYFINNMFRKSPYDIFNSYTSLLNLKMTFNKKTSDLAINGKIGLPSEVSGIHETYKGIICPITISNHNIGVNNQLIPTLELKDIKFGIFNF